ncbi:AraC family transcriptional regulator [Rhodoferax sp. AJA081-3]|uniref:AraC family transcriptional regulator n=1 Tax=Rhodoferax sp. AJA081-3 TaxID=2752316 RepID=UPI001ADFB0FA|nr:AraC family transcriptional regulator [Rhodoferax sp. AJA081-3]QTN27429.1 AraC family transcriptional regulator [Rhodoferax sp. AJA081-3]
MLDPRTVSSAYVRTLLATVEAQGVSADAVLQGLPVDATEMAQANGRIGVGISRLVWDRALALTGDPLLGLQVGEAMKPNTFRVLGLATMSCATLEQAIGVMLRYQRLVSESGSLSAHAHPNGDVTLVHTAQTLKVPILPQQVEALLAGVYRQALWLAGRPFLPVDVCFRHAALGDVQRYVQCFGITPQFGADANAITYAKADLQAPLPQADAELCRMHCEVADRQLASLPQVGYASSFAVQWLSNRGDAPTGIEDLAAALGMGVRSLQRALKDEGTSWGNLVDGMRRDALAALLQQGLSLEAAAQRLGYHDASSVSRAAKRWFGKTPGQWRADAKAQ